MAIQRNLRGIITGGDRPSFSDVVTGSDLFKFETQSAQGMLDAAKRDRMLNERRPMRDTGIAQEEARSRRNQQTLMDMVKAEDKRREANIARFMEGGDMLGDRVNSSQMTSDEAFKLLKNHAESSAEGKDEVDGLLQGNFSAENILNAASVLLGGSEVVVGEEPINAVSAQDLQAVKKSVGVNKAVKDKTNLKDVLLAARDDRPVDALLGFSFGGNR